MSLASPCSPRTGRDELGRGSASVSRRVVSTAKQVHGRRLVEPLDVQVTVTPIEQGLQVRQREPAGDQCDGRPAPSARAMEGILGGEFGHSSPSREDQTDDTQGKQHHARRLGDGRNGGIDGDPVREGTKGRAPRSVAREDGRVACCGIDAQVPGTPSTSLVLLPGHRTPRLGPVRGAFAAAGRSGRERYPDASSSSRCQRQAARAVEVIVDRGRKAFAWGTRERP